MGGTGRNLGDGIAGGAGEGMAALDHLGGALSSTGGEMGALGSAGIAAGIRLAGSLDNAGAAAGELNSSLSESENAATALGNSGINAGTRIRNAFENAASASDTMGTSFAKNFTRAAGAGESFGASIKTGIIGALDTAKRRVTSFASDGVNSVKKIGNAFLHPIATIKGKFTSSMRDAANATDEVGDEANQAGKGLDNMGKTGASAGEKLKNGLGAALKVVAALAAAAVVVTGIAKFTSAALGASQAAENISYSFDKTFGDSAPDVEAWAGNFSSAIHRSQSEVKGFLTTNKQFYEGLGITGQSAMDLSKMTTSLAYDLGNKFGVDDAEALSGLQDAITGNAQALSAYGVNLDSTALKQTALNMGLTGNLEDMDEATMAQIRFNSIMEQTGDIQQNASKSLGGFAGGVKAMKSVWTDFLEKAGAKLAPTFDRIFGVILEAWPKVEPALIMLVDLLASGFEQAVPVILQFSTDLLPQMLELLGNLAPLFMDIGGQILPLLSQVLGTVMEAFEPLMPLIETLISTLLPPLAEIFGTLVSTLLPPLATLVGALAPILDALSPVLEIVAAAVGLVANAIAGLIGWLTKAIQKVGEFAQGLKNSSVGKFVGGIGEGIGTAADSVKNFFAGNAKGTDDFTGGWTRINEAGGELIQAKHGEGIAYLPRGSAVIPASKTDEILSDNKNSSGNNVIDITAQLQVPDPKPTPSWVPVLLEGNSKLSPALGEPDTNDGTHKNDDGGNKGDGAGDNGGGQAPAPSPAETPLAPLPAGSEYTIRRVIDLNITISSPNGSVPREVMEAVKREVLEAVKENQNSEFSSLAIQNGYAG